MHEIHQTDAKFSRLFLPQKARAGVEYVPSQFALPFSHGEKQYVFHTLTKQCVEAELPPSCGSGDGYDELIGGYFLVPSGKDECAFYENALTMMKVLYGSESQIPYTVLTTMACNARCVYCYQAGARPETMKPETAEQTVRYILDTRDRNKPVSLIWFGGEPLLSERTIDLISRSLTDAGVQFTSSMVTNGSLITQETVDKMTGFWNLTSIQVSMDGAEEDYVRRKRYCSGSSQYQAVMDAISRMSAAEIDVYVRCNVDTENWPRIPAYLEEMRAGVANKERVTVYFAPLDEVRFSDSGLPLWKEIQAMAPQIESAGFRRIHPGDNALKLRVFHCQSERNAPVISPAGNLLPCKHCLETSRTGDIWNGLTEAAKKAISGRTNHVIGKCRACTFLPLCTPFGGCPVKDKECRELNRLFVSETLSRLAENADRETANDP